MVFAAVLAEVAAAAAASESPPLCSWWQSSLTRVFRQLSADQTALKVRGSVGSSAG